MEGSSSLVGTSSAKYKNIKVTGPISIERIERIPLTRSELARRDYSLVLIMGPTGSGKSTFIESLGLKDTERISSNGLEGFTQRISTYKIKNAVDADGDPIYLVDSPGFADTKISEMTIVSMLRKWIKANGHIFVNRIIYLTPITQVRFPGSQRRVLKIFQELTGVKTADCITIVTTMWDSLGGERAIKRAEETHKQLEGDIWKEFIDTGAMISKFQNTQDSALSILDEAFSRGSTVYFSVEVDIDSALRDTPFSASLQRDLQERIQNLQIEIPNVQADLEQVKAQANQELQGLLQTRLEEAEKLLETFKAELQEFGPAPSADSLAKSGREEKHRDDQKDQDRGDVVTSTVYVGPASDTAQAVYSPTAVVPTDAQRSNNHRPRLRDRIIACGCCGKGVEKNHEM